MHPESYEQASQYAQLLKADLGDRELMIADIGSQDINGTYRSLFSNERWHYLGIDMAPGKNVDHVATEQELYPEPESFDVVICGQVLEHAEMPWVLIRKIAAITKPGGRIWLSAPYQWDYHPYPKDCWRIYPDGMRALLRWASLTEKQVYVNANDTIALAEKP